MQTTTSHLKAINNIARADHDNATELKQGSPAIADKPVRCLRKHHMVYLRTAMLQSVWRSSVHYIKIKRQFEGELYNLAVLEPVWP